jgi:hypothetical protein
MADEAKIARSVPKRKIDCIVKPSGNHSHAAIISVGGVWQDDVRFNLTREGVRDSSAKSGVFLRCRRRERRGDCGALREVHQHEAGRHSRRQPIESAAARTACTRLARPIRTDGWTSPAFLPSPQVAFRCACTHGIITRGMGRTTMHRLPCP